MPPPKVFSLLCAATFCAASGFGCSKAAEWQSVLVASKQTATAQVTPAVVDTTPVAARPNVAVSDDFAKASNSSTECRSVSNGCRIP
jgi:hypothetical protein